MSTFEGRIKEYPELAIDNFTPNSYSQFFLLSHVHKDHTRGLENEDFNKTLYCSKQTARMLPLMETRASQQLMYAHLKDHIKAIPYYEPVSVKIKNEVIKFTFYPANHCPGASVILIEGERGTVLYTGDMRAEPDFVLNALGCLRNFRIKNLYMDTTCCYDDRRNFISKSDSVALLIDLVKAYPDHFHMYLDTWTPGYEEMWITIKENFNCKIHVSNQRYNMYVNLDEMYEDVLTTDPASTRFHSCRWDKGCFNHEANMVSIHPVPNRNTKAFDFKPSKQSRLLQSDLPRHCKPYQQMILPFSTHSSLTEIVFFYKFIRPKKFTPCVAHGGWKTQYEMHQLLRSEGCIVSDTPSSSEIERGNETSTCSSNEVSSNLRSVDDDESTTCSTINYVSTAEGPSAKSAPSAASNNNIPSNPLSEKSINIHKTPNSDNTSNQKIPAAVKDKVTTTKSSIHSVNDKSSRKLPLQEKGNVKSNLHASASLPTKSSTHQLLSPFKWGLSLSHSSLTISEKTKVKEKHQNLKHIHSREDASCFNNQPDKTADSLDPNCIALSIPNSIDHNILVTLSNSQTNIQVKRAQIVSDSDDNNLLNEFSLSRKSTQNFVNSFVAMRKRRRRSREKSDKNNPIIL